ncbi:hypothetical protein SLEP1_g13824 [Rubroshorea leprosula]|uniref:Uncharacterized protein n=1 Tax=Rubroshorea leprosula TaxID=152421 RepID=A0AAV5IN29_9ROSI|nr:hypothetical protein SLEP1_g13824 [Rubroshorea leprosula]
MIGWGESFPFIFSSSLTVDGRRRKITRVFPVLICLYRQRSD